MASPGKAPLVKLNNGNTIPNLGLGTYQSQPGEVEAAVKHAIDIGYRHIDCAWFYGNEKEIGTAIREKLDDKTVKREDLFITSKVWNDAHKKNDVIKRCKEAVSSFGLDYIDLFLIHWPFCDGDEDVDYLETWTGMEECLKLGLTRNIGVSNFNHEQLERLLGVAQVKPVCNQVECHPYLNQTKLLEYCRERDIVVVAYTPLGKPGRFGVDVIKDATIVELAGKYGKSSAQITLRYLIQHGVIPIPKSSNAKRIEENFNVFDFELTPEDQARVDNINKNMRLVTFGKGLKNYPFDLEY